MEINFSDFIINQKHQIRDKENKKRIEFQRFTEFKMQQMIYGTLSAAARAIPTGNGFESTTDIEVFFVRWIMSIKIIKQNCQKNQHSDGSKVFKIFFF